MTLHEKIDSIINNRTVTQANYTGKSWEHFLDKDTPRIYIYCNCGNGSNGNTSNITIHHVNSDGIDTEYSSWSQLGGSTTSGSGSAISCFGLGYQVIPGAKYNDKIYASGGYGTLGFSLIIV